MQGVEEPQGDAVEEELVVPDSRRQVLLLEDLVVVDAELKVGGAIPSKVVSFNGGLLVETSSEVLLGCLSVLVET